MEKSSRSLPAMRTRCAENCAVFGSAIFSWTKNGHLPRQARDKHQESAATTEPRFLRLLPQTIFVTGDGATNAIDNYGQLMRKAYNTKTMVDPEVELTLNWLGQKQHSFLDLSLCLSRACLGRMMHFYINGSCPTIFR